jgi:hypothetical protein
VFIGLVGVVGVVGASELAQDIPPKAGAMIAPATTRRLETLRIEAL